MPWVSYQSRLWFTEKSVTYCVVAMVKCLVLSGMTYSSLVDGVDIVSMLAVANHGDREF
jgi:hypothetical protein